MKTTRVIIIGAGISGLATANLLTSNSIENVILESGNKPGGLIKCDYVDGHLFHRVGGHVFNTRVEKVAKWFWEKFNRETEFLNARRDAAIYMNGCYIGYPLENYLYMLDQSTARQIINELLDIDKQEHRSPFSHKNFEDFLINNFGVTLYNLYFKPYNQKIWKTDLKLVALPWLEGKLPMPGSREVILSNILREEESKMVHSTFFYPVSGGSQFIADRLARGINLQTSYHVESIRRSNKNWVINEEWFASEVVFTGNARALGAMVKDVSPGINSMLDSLKTLKSNGTSNLLCETDSTPRSWLYLPGIEQPAHRVIYTGNFSPSNQPNGSRRSCTVEFSGKTSLNEMKTAIKQIPGNLKAIDHNYEPSSYVIQHVGDQAKLSAAKKALRQENFHLAGRFAEWEYYNMDKAIERAMDVAGLIALNG